MSETGWKWASVNLEYVHTIHYYQKGFPIPSTGIVFNIETIFVKISHRSVICYVTAFLQVQVCLANYNAVDCGMDNSSGGQFCNGSCARNTRTRDSVIILSTSYSSWCQMQWLVCKI
jgi:hypothetical protein